MIEHELNPAGRLYNFLQSMQEAADQARTCDVWGAYLGTTVDESAYWDSMAILTRQPAELAAEIDAADPSTLVVSKDVMRRPLSAVQSVLTYAGHPYSHISEPRSLLAAGTLVELEVTSKQLNSLKGAIPQPKELLDEIRTIALSMLNSLAKGTISDKVLAVEIRAYVEAIVRSIDLFKLTGQADVQKSFEAMVGHLDLLKATPAVKKAKPSFWTKVDLLGNRILTIAAVTGVPATVALNAQPIIKAITGV